MKELKVEIIINIRFSETDAMGVVWHGNYLKYFEDAREAFGSKYELTNLEMYKKEYFTPIVKSNIDYKSPVYYGDKIAVIIKYVFSPAAKINFEYEVINISTQKICAIGRTTQVFVIASEGTLVLNKPPFYVEWENKNGMEQG